MRVLPYGPSAALVECDGSDEVHRLAAEVRRRAPVDVREVVPGALTVLLEGPGALAAARDARTWTLPATAPGEAADVTLPVRWEGADLPEVAQSAGRPQDEVVGALESATLVVAFCGFAPGFAYLTGLPGWLHLPRLETPRTVVPAGSVALAGEYAGVYPRASPGGWRLVGRTDASLWDVDRNPPALLTPGTRVRFVGLHP